MQRKGLYFKSPLATGLGQTCRLPESLGLRKKKNPSGCKQGTKVQRIFSIRKLFVVLQRVLLCLMSLDRKNKDQICKVEKLPCQLITTHQHCLSSSRPLSLRFQRSPRCEILHPALDFKVGTPDALFVFSPFRSLNQYLSSVFVSTFTLSLSISCLPPFPTASPPSIHRSLPVFSQ